MELSGGVILIHPAHTYSAATSLLFPPSAFPACEYSYLPIFSIQKKFPRCRFCNCFYAFTSAHHFPICISTQESRRTQSSRNWKIIITKLQFKTYPCYFFHNLLVAPHYFLSTISYHNRSYYFWQKGYLAPRFTEV